MMKKKIYKQQKSYVMMEFFLLIHLKVLKGFFYMEISRKNERNILNQTCVSGFKCMLNMSIEIIFFYFPLNWSYVISSENHVVGK